MTIKLPPLYHTKTVRNQDIVRDVLVRGRTQAQVAAEYGIDPSRVSRIARLAALRDG